jgi:RNA polymerase sigma factor (sigma-70 family)
MATSRSETIIQHLRRTLRQDKDGLTDGQLLEAFVAHQDAAALESLVRRHGPMVLGVCRRILRDPHDAEDAFQATFLVLARKAAAVSPRALVGNWLYGVAHTTAIRLRATNAKRRTRERQVVDMPEREAVQHDLHDDLLQRLDEELARLPDRFRVPIVLCDLEGRSRKEVARQLKIPEGTLSSRLTTARRLLAKRMTRHGFSVSGGALALAVAHETTSAAVPATLVSSTVKAATLTTTGLISVQVAALTQGVLKTMFLTKMKTILVFIATVVVIGGSSLTYWTRAAEDAGSAPQGIKSKLAKDVPTGDRPEIKPGNGERLIQKVYALAGMFGSKPLTNGEVEVLIRVIQGTIEPQSWCINGGEGAIDYFPLTSSLVISQSPAIQEKIQGLLEKLRENKAQNEKKEKRKESQASQRDECVGYVRILREPPKYKGIFKKMLAVTAEHFEIITYADQYQGLIEARTADAKREGMIRQATVRFLACDDGGLMITVLVNKIRTSDDKGEFIGRDTELEQTMLRMDEPKGQKGKSVTLPTNAQNH